jgi:ATP/maltotriose-dependent transcriptional regulator MalT
MVPPRLWWEYRFAMRRIAGGRGWWRYHHLFADLLRVRLQQEQAGRVACLHRNAATGCQQHGLPDDAVRHAVAAADRDPPRLSRPAPR